MIKIYQKQPIQAEQFNGTSESANRLGVEWDEGNGFIGDPSYTPESQPCWYIPEDKFNVFGYDENSIKPDDWVIECSENIRLIMTNNEFKKYYDELPVIPKAVAEWISRCKRDKVSIAAAMDQQTVPTAVSNYFRYYKTRDQWISLQDNFARSWLDGYRVEAQHDTRTD